MASMRENRTERRAGIMAKVEVLWESETGSPRIVPAKLEDKSHAGACLRTKEPISAGTRLTVQWRNGHFSGTVAYCNEHGAEFVLGIHRDPEEGTEK